MKFLVDVNASGMLARRVEEELPDHNEV